MAALTSGWNLFWDESLKIPSLSLHLFLPVPAPSLPLSPSLLIPGCLYLALSREVIGCEIWNHVELHTHFFPQPEESWWTEVVASGDVALHRPYTVQWTCRLTQTLHGAVDMSPYTDLTRCSGDVALHRPYTVQWRCRLTQTLHRPYTVQWTCPLLDGWTLHGAVEMSPYTDLTRCRGVILM